MCTQKISCRPLKDPPVLRYAGASNGVHEVWLDGSLVYSKKDVVYRRTADIKIDRFTFRNFHGGSKDTFRPSQTQQVWYASFFASLGKSLHMHHAVAMH